MFLLSLIFRYSSLISLRKSVALISVSWFVSLSISVTCLASLPPLTTWRHIIGAGCLAGIGFTMALFIANLAFKGDATHLDASKLGILGASLVSTIAGLAILMSCKPISEADAESAEERDAIELDKRSYTNTPDANDDNFPKAKAG